MLEDRDARRTVVQSDNFVTANKQQDIFILQSLQLRTIVANTLAARAIWCLSNHGQATVWQLRRGTTCLVF